VLRPEGQLSCFKTDHDMILAVTTPEHITSHTGGLYNNVLDHLPHPELTPFRKNNTTRASSTVALNPQAWSLPMRKLTCQKELFKVYGIIGKSYLRHYSRAAEGVTWKVCAVWCKYDALTS